MSNASSKTLNSNNYLNHIFSETRDNTYAPIFKTSPSEMASVKPVRKQNVAYENVKDHNIDCPMFITRANIAKLLVNDLKDLSNMETVYANITRYM